MSSITLPRSPRGEIQKLIGVSYKENPQEYMSLYRRLKRKHLSNLTTKWKQDNRIRTIAMNKDERGRLKIQVLSHYSSRKMRCARCGFKDIRALVIDHIDNDGAKQRRELFGDRLSAGTTFYRWLRKNNYPKGYQVLCANCNWIKKEEYEYLNNFTIQVYTS